ncbi:MAG: HlyC/CorC family transporter [Phycisphaerales bacterium]|nr:HlyC/CorC family transporter [Phycisphaerales bacterium]
MLLILGFALLGVTLYVYTVELSLRGYSRSKIAERLNTDAEHAWLDWLGRRESEVIVATSVTKFFATVGAAVALAQWANDLADVHPVQLLVGELAIVILIAIPLAVFVPIAVSGYAAEAVVIGARPLLNLLYSALLPLLIAFRGLDWLIRRVIGASPSTPAQVTEQVEQAVLDTLSEGELKGAVDEDQREMVQAIFELPDTAVSEIMTPRPDIIAISVDAAYDEVRRVMVESAHSRIPVYHESIDHIVGVLYAKDILRLNPGDPFNARELMRVVPFVPETKTIDDLLTDFRTEKVQIAIVVDEYGGTAGIATLEDILEELVGEIDDEYDEPATPAIQRIDETTLEVDARVAVHEINTAMEINLPEDGAYETIGGFVFSHLGKIPMPGETLEHGGIEIQVVDAEPRKINRLRIHLPRSEASVVS